MKPSLDDLDPQTSQKIFKISDWKNDWPEIKPGHGKMTDPQPHQKF